MRCTTAVLPDSGTHGSTLRPLVVQYLYVHAPGEAFYYPTVRATASAARVAVRYLECALTQAASLRLTEADCDLALATNVTDRNALGQTAARLFERIESLGVQILPTEYVHRPGDRSATYVSSRYVLDAILSAIEGQPAERSIWLTDLDCVWIDAARVFGARPSADEIGCLHLLYPPDWDVVGFGEVGRTPRGIGELAASMGGPADPALWVGGELLGGTAQALGTLVTACDALDAELESAGHVLPTEEQIFTLAGALGRLSFRDLSTVADRMHTGPRSHGPKPVNPTALGLWHLPAEKGLSLRRAAADMLDGRANRVGRDFADPARAARRFNVEGAGLTRSVRDDSWIVGQKILSRMRRS